MGRPREHDEDTRAALIAAAERLVAAGGPGALSVRAVADEAGTTTRAVYSLFEGKDGLVDALAGRAFELLGTGLQEVPETDDPVGDLVEIGMQLYRRFVLEHPSLYRIAFQRIVPEFRLTPELAEQRERSFRRLEAKMQRVADAGRLARPVRAAAVEFNAMCEGLANAELRGGTMRAEPQEAAWREAFETLVRGLTSPG